MILEIKISDQANTSSNATFNDSNNPLTLPTITSGSVFSLDFMWALSSGDGTVLFNLTPPPTIQNADQIFSVACNYDAGQGILWMKLVDDSSNPTIDFAELDGFSAAIGNGGIVPTSGTGVLTRSNTIGPNIVWETH
jgi:hypothetical protein